MHRVGTVNYHVHKPERQAFEIDAGGVVGRLIAPDLIPTEIGLHDTRAGDTAVSFADDSVAFETYPSAVTAFAGDGWQAQYDAELTALLTRAVGVQEVVVFDHTVREDDPNSDRKPARNVHSDYSAEGAQKRLVDILGADRAADWAEGRYGFINVWRPVGAPINSAPLGFVRPATVKPEDWILIDLIYPDRRGHIMGLAANAGHEWVYQSNMTPDEVAFFNIYDSQGLASVAHSAVDRVEDASITRIRKSIESRTLVRY
ncbi:CmcJ/NvfI family oxidoreductase [uncultured Tateyamaria sp.]|uniref:CmcJ/NvfI family oxidoreductase n=1 Tax=uncultured Tateyamaria sp. TaxID=455651 RepID=UPI0026147AD5|nr:CmcJ/NvfI family oxidoreductase [uncultured Tateyamaria sp.]